MTKIELTEKNIYCFIEEQKEHLPVFSQFWEVYSSENEETVNYFEFLSKPHYANTIRPENFYKKIISIINFNEN